MMRVFVHVLLLAGLACMPAAASEIYRTTDDEGNVVYTDDPPSDDAEPVELDPLTTVPGTPTDEGGDRADAGDGDTQKSAEDERNAVTGVRLTYPENDKAVRHNGGNVPFRVAFVPEEAQLPQGHRVEIVLDGEVRGSGRGDEIVVSEVIRGPHRVRARVVDASGDTRFQSETIKFFLLRKALGGSD